MLQGSPSKGFFPWGKILWAVRLSFRSFLSAMHNMDPQSTYHSVGLSLSLSNRQTRSLCHRWLSLPLLWETRKARLWSLWPSSLPFCPVSWSQYNISSFSPPKSQNMSCFSLVPIPQCLLPSARIPCGCTRSYPVCGYFSPSWTFLRCLNACGFSLFSVGFSGWNANTFHLSNDKLFWMKASSFRTAYSLSVRVTMFGITSRLCNPIPLVSKTSRGGGNCYAGCSSFAPYAGSIWVCPWKRYSSVLILSIPNWHFFRAISRFPDNFFLWHSILVDNSVLVW